MIATRTTPRRVMNCGIVYVRRPCVSLMRNRLSSGYPRPARGPRSRLGPSSSGTAVSQPRGLRYPLANVAPPGASPAACAATSAFRTVTAATRTDNFRRASQESLRRPCAASVTAPSRGAADEARVLLRARRRRTDGLRGLPRGAPALAAPRPAARREASRLRRIDGDAVAVAQQRDRPGAPRPRAQYVQPRSRGCRRRSGRR